MYRKRSASERDVFSTAGAGCPQFHSTSSAEGGEEVWNACVKPLNCHTMLSLQPH